MILMNLKRVKIVIIFFGLTCISTISGQQQCPTGKPNTKATCDSVDRCPSGSICYRKNDEDSNKFCCGDLDKFCPTKMHAFNSDNGNSFRWGVGEGVFKTKWYTIILGSETVACPLPFSFTYADYRMMKLLPVDFNETNAQNSTPKACDINSDCKTESEEFCGATSNPSFGFLDKSGKNQVPLRFCYKFQNFDVKKITPVIKGDRIGLEGCDNNSDCFNSHGSESFCFINKDSKVNNVGKEGKVTKTLGVCAIAHVCDNINHESMVATLTKNADFCTTTNDCEGSSNHPSTMKPECVDGPSNSGKMCCLRHNRVCEVGIAQNPVKSCSNSEDCHTNGPVASIWCDAKSKHCCEDDGTKGWLCPDGFTTLLNQTRCEGYNETDIDSGKCPTEQAICRYGRCCPPLRIDQTNITVVSEKAFITEYSCDPMTLANYVYAFCDPKIKKIVIIGKEDVGGFNDEYRGFCFSNDVCIHSVEVCVTITPGAGLCLQSPFYIMPEDKSIFWKYVANKSFFITLITFVLSIISWMLYYCNLWDHLSIIEHLRLRKLNKALFKYRWTSKKFEMKKWDYAVSRWEQPILFKEKTMAHVVMDIEQFKENDRLELWDDDYDWEVFYGQPASKILPFNEDTVDEVEEKRVSKSMEHYEKVLTIIKNECKRLLLNMPGRLKAVIDDLEKPDVQKMLLDDYQKYMKDTEKWVEDVKEEVNSYQCAIMKHARDEKQRKCYEEEHKNWLEEQDKWLERQKNKAYVFGGSYYAKMKSELWQEMERNLKEFENWSQSRVKYLEDNRKDTRRYFIEGSDDICYFLLLFDDLVDDLISF